LDLDHDSVVDRHEDFALRHDDPAHVVLLCVLGRGLEGLEAVSGVEFSMVIMQSGGDGSGGLTAPSKSASGGLDRGPCRHHADPQCRSQWYPRKQRGYP